MNTHIKNITLLIIRVLVGGMIAWAGIQKLMNMDMTLLNMSTFFKLSTPVIWAVSIGELVAGLGVLVGAYTRLAAFGLAIIMAGAVYYTKGLSTSPLLLLLGSIVLMLTGGGLYAYTMKKTKPATETPPASF